MADIKIPDEAKLVALDDGTQIAEGWQCPLCHRDFVSTHTARAASGLHIQGIGFVCHRCAVNRDRPWMTALEMQFAAMSYAQQVKAEAAATGREFGC